MQHPREHGPGGPSTTPQAVVRLGEVLHVKLLQAVPPGRLRLISHNAAYEPVEVAMADVDVVGRVVWKSGRL